MTRAALILCGGRSRRMGVDKGALPFGDETLLERVTRIVSTVVDEVWLVAREGQEVPTRSGDARSLPIARDPASGDGPLAGLAAGLRAMRASRAFLTSCDAPLVLPAYVTRLFDLAEEHRAAIPEIGGYLMTTSAVYDKDLLPVADALLAAGERRPRMLAREPGVRIVDEALIRAADPDLRSLRDCDTPEQYREALRIAGLPVPSWPTLPGDG